MTVLGAKYPYPLREAVGHAERLCQVLTRCERSLANPRSVPWLVGRAREVEVVVALALSDWTSGRLGLEQAARSVTAYVEELRRGARSALPLSGELDGCRDRAFPTEAKEAVGDESSVADGPAPVPVTHDTWFGPGDECGDDRAPLEPDAPPLRESRGTAWEGAEPPQTQEVSLLGAVRPGGP